MSALGNAYKLYMPERIVAYHQLFDHAILVHLHVIHTLLSCKDVAVGVAVDVLAKDISDQAVHVSVGVVQQIVSP